ncbi:MAG TPA: H/ACA RNA-protein complex component Gar1 [Thermoplasmata archaeon]
MARLGDRAEPRDREVGVVVAVTPLGQLTARSLGPSYPREGTAVVDVRGEVHGRVARVFGPVERPYFIVRLKRPPKPTQGAGLVGSALVREKE